MDVKTATLSGAGLILIKYFEGCQLKAYQDSVGCWTIGWGAIRHPDGTPVKEGDTCTQSEADSMLHDQVELEGGHFVKAWWHGPIEQYQYDALCSFCYNRGAGRFRQLLAMSHGNDEIAKNILLYDWAGNPQNHLLGLKRRRYAEQAMFLNKPWDKCKEIT